MAEPIYDDDKVLVAKIEATYGTDSVPTGGANAILATQFSLTPMAGEDISRDLLRGFFGNQENIRTATRGVMSFSVEWVPSGAAGTAPKWGPLERACGVSQTVSAGVNVVYAPIGFSAQESVSIYFQRGPTRHVFLGARGTSVLEVPAQGIPRKRYTLTGIWVEPSAQSAITPDFTGWQAPVIATHQNTPTFEINNVPLVLKSLSFDLGNQVEPRFLIGRHEIRITGKTELIRARVEATPLATFNPWALSKHPATLAPVELVHGTAAGKIASLTTSTCQLMPPEGDEEDQKIVEWDLMLKPIPATANAQWSMTLT